jgi:uncharacterized protein (TIGR02996 family)
MTDHDALLRAIAENPDEDTPRLAFADYLDEIGGDANGAQAEFIRIECELSRLPADAADRKPLEARRTELWVAHRREWKAIVPDIPGINWRGYDRGFLTVLDADQMSLFVDHARELFAAAPIQGVRILAAGPNVTPALAALPRLGWLRELDLTACRGAARPQDRRIRSADGYEWTVDGVLTDDDAATLANSPGVANLRVLRLGGNRITGTGVRALAASPHLTNLRRLDLTAPVGGRPISPEAVARLRRAFPGAEVLVTDPIEPRTRRRRG